MYNYLINFDNIVMVNAKHRYHFWTKCTLFGPLKFAKVFVVYLREC